MLSKRIIPCLDVHQGRVVKGVSFVGLKDAGNPVDIAWRYNDEGADEITFLDISASLEERDLILPIIEAVASKVFIPLTVGGGVRSVADVQRLLNSGADKVSMNSAALQRPALIQEAAAFYGSQCIVLAIDAKKDGDNWWVYTKGGRDRQPKSALAWALEAVALGAGEILLTSMDQDGQQNGFDLALTKAVSTSVSVPVIASGGVGNLEHLYDGIVHGHADAVLAASIFHYGKHSIQEAKSFLRARGITVR